jgi:hypothetical protein
MMGGEEQLSSGGRLVPGGARGRRRPATVVLQGNERMISFETCARGTVGRLAWGRTGALALHLT